MLARFRPKKILFVRGFHTKLENFDLEYLLNDENFEEIKQNITLRKGVGDISLVRELNKKIKSSPPNETEIIQQELLCEIEKIPNRSHRSVISYGTEPKVIKEIGTKKIFESQPLTFQEIVKRMSLARMAQLGNFSGSKSYYILGQLANLDRALVQYTAHTLIKNDFELISVPDIIPRDVVHSCGLITTGVRNQVFFLDEALHKKDMCLSGTSEMSLAALYRDHIFEENELPKKLAAISRCYRAETSNLADERGLYRVHEFTKVEMFAIVHPNDSESTLEAIRQIQEDHFEPMNMHMRVLDMPSAELGAPAYRKYDIEAWMPGRGMYGEISSCSNCTDFQARRLNIKYRTNNGEIRFVHTLNGTAAAIPRLLIALLETGQQKKGTIEIPEVLRKYMNGAEIIKKQTGIPHLKLIKHSK